MRTYYYVDYMALPRGKYIFTKFQAINHLESNQRTLITYKNITTVFFVSEKNKYSYSPLLIIAEQFSTIQIHYIATDIFKILDEQSIRAKIKEDFKSLSIKPDTFYIYLFSFNSWYRKHFCMLSDELKSIMPYGLRIAGGPDPTGDYYKLLSYFDIICVGEGEFFLFQLYKRLLTNSCIGNEVKYTAKLIPGLLYNGISQYESIELDHSSIKKKHNKNLVNKQYDIEELHHYISFLKNWYIQYNPHLTSLLNTLIDNITCPEDTFSIFPVFPIHNLFFHPIELIRGCSVGCFFCQTSYIYGKNLRFKNIEIVKEAIKFQIKHKKKHIRFISPDFLSYYFENNTVNLEIFKNIYITAFNEDPASCIYMGSFPSEINPALLNENILKSLKKYAVNRNITIGIQTFSKNIQIVSNRKTDIDQIYDILSYSNKYFTVILDIIFGLPGEKDEDRELTLTSLNKILNEKVNANIHFFLPLPGTPFANKKPANVSKKQMKQIMMFFSRGLAKGNFMQQYKEFMIRLTLPNTTIDS